MIINISTYTKNMEIKDMGKCCALEKTLDHNDSTYSRPKGKFSIKYKVMIEFMNVDCETTDEYGRPQCPNSEKVGTMMREIGNLIDFLAFRN